MKKIILLLALLGGYNVYSADRLKSKATNDELTAIYTASQSTTPTHALAVKSNRDDVDLHEIIKTNAMTVTINPTNVVIIRGESLALTNCSASNGTVQVTPTQIIVATNVIPERVLCSEANGVQRVFYTTYRQ